MKGIKTGGRTEGTPNRLTNEIREVLKSIIEKELEHLPNQLEKLEPKERLEIMVKLLPYIIPKLSELDNKISAENLSPMIIDLSGDYVP